MVCAFPFSRLDREQVRELVPQPGATITPAIMNNISSVQVSSVKKAV